MACVCVYSAAMASEQPEPSRTEAGAPRGRAYYGWVIVAVLFAVEFFTYATTGSTITLFFPKMMDELGWSLTQLTAAVTAAGIAGMFAAPLTGPLLDRYGARPVLAGGAVTAGVGLVLMMRVQELWQYYLLFAVIGAFGMGELGRLSTPVVVSKWFIRRRARALAIASTGNVAGGMVMAPVAGALIVGIGWRETWGVMAAGILLFNLPLVLLFMRRQPEDMGLLSDGDTTPTRLAAASSSGAVSGDETTWTLHAATRTRTLWLMVAGSNFVGFATASVSFHQIPFFINEGMSIQGASYVLSLSLLMSALSRFLWAFLLEHFSVRVCLSTMASFRALGTLALVVVPYPYNIVPFVVGWGLLGGAFGLVQPMAWANYYGRRFQGSIQGTLRPFTGASRLIAPISIAALFDVTGSYAVGFALAFGVATAAALLFVGATQPRRG